MASLSETTIRERWNTFSDEIKSLSEKINSVDDKIESLDAEIKSLRGDLEPISLADVVEPISLGGLSPKDIYHARLQKQFAVALRLFGDDDAKTTRASQSSRSSRSSKPTTAKSDLRSIGSLSSVNDELSKIER